MAKNFEILIANGVNLDLLGTRQPDIYGNSSLQDIQSQLNTELEKLKVFFDCDATLHFFQSNSEVDLLTEVAKPWDGIVLNAGAWTHTSLALSDRLVGLEAVFIEVHLSNTAKREGFRQHSYLSAHAAGVVYGLGKESYRTGLFALLSKLTDFSSD